MKRGTQHKPTSSSAWSQNHDLPHHLGGRRGVGANDVIRSMLLLVFLEAAGVSDSRDVRVRAIGGDLSYRRK